MHLGRERPPIFRAPNLDRRVAEGVAHAPFVPSLLPTAALTVTRAAQSAAAEAAPNLHLAKDIADPSLNTWPNTFRVHRYVPAVEYIRAQRARTLVMRDMDKLMSQYDVFLSSTNSRSLALTNRSSSWRVRGLRMLPQHGACS